MAKNPTNTNSGKRQYGGFTIRLAITIVIGFLIVDAYFIYSSYTDYLDKSEQEVMERLQAITSTAALDIDGNAHKKLQEQYRLKMRLPKTDRIAHTASFSKNYIRFRLQIILTPVFTRSFGKMTRNLKMTSGISITV